jgi:hypothetical protein
MFENMVNLLSCNSTIKIDDDFKIQKKICFFIGKKYNLMKRNLDGKWESTDIYLNDNLYGDNIERIKEHLLWDYEVKYETNKSSLDIRKF